MSIIIQLARACGYGCHPSHQYHHHHNYDRRLRVACVPDFSTSREIACASSSLFTPSSWLLPFAIAATTSLANAERQHAHNKNFCTNCKDHALWEQFVAQSVLHQAKCIMTATQKDQQCERPCAALAPASTVASRRPKARSPKELFKVDFIKTLKAQKVVVSVASSEFWIRLHAAWDSLSPDRKQMCQQIANSEEEPQPQTCASPTCATDSADRKSADKQTPPGATKQRLDRRRGTPG